MSNIKYLLASAGWLEVSTKIEERTAEVDKEILEEADEISPSIDKLRKLSSERKALTFLLELPESLLQTVNEIEY